MIRPDRAQLRTTFDEAAELYARVRPGYPPQLFDDLRELAGIGPGCRVLELGCGTGQATVPLAERGCALEPATRSNLLACIGHLIDTRYAGCITKRYLTVLRVAYRQANGLLS